MEMDGADKLVELVGVMFQCSIHCQMRESVM